MKLTKYLSNVLDESWNQLRGIEICSVGIASISYDEDSKKLINMRNQGAMLSDATIREGYVQGSVARGMEAAGSNSAGAAQTFMGMGMGMQNAGGFMAGASAANLQQMQMQNTQRATASCCTATDCKRLAMCLRCHQHWEILYRMRQTKTSFGNCLEMQLRSRKHRKILHGMRQTKTGKRQMDLQLRYYQHREILHRMRQTKRINHRPAFCFYTPLHGCGINLNEEESSEYRTI